MTATAFSGIIPTNNLPIATPISLGITRADNVNITQDADGVLHVSGVITNGTSVTNVAFTNSTTIGWTVPGAAGIYQFYVINGSINSNLVSTINFGQIVGVPLFLLQSNTNVFARTNDSRTLNLGNAFSIFTGSLSGNASTAAAAASGSNINTNNASTFTSGTLPAAQMPALSGDITTTAGSTSTALKNTGTAGTYTKTTFDADGRETSGTTLSASDIPALPYVGTNAGTGWNNTFYSPSLINTGSYTNQYPWGYDYYNGPAGLGGGTNTGTGSYGFSDSNFNSTVMGVYYRSNTLTVATILTGMTNDDCWVGRMSNYFMEISMSNNVATFTRLGP